MAKPLQNNSLELKLAAPFEPLLNPRRYKVIYGGRGSGKSYSIAMLLVLASYQHPLRILCAREIQKSITDSVHQLLADTIERLGLSSHFEIQKTQILGKNGSRFIFEGLRSNVSKVKGLEGIDRVWVEEAESLTNHSWDTLIPTIRAENSEIWLSFNPLDEMDATYQRFVVEPPPDALVIKVNYDDNPWFPDTLEAERLHMKDKNLALYAHIWEGDCYANKDGAYYTNHLIDKQITSVPVDRALPVNSSWDLGIADATAIWLWQVDGKSVRFVSYYEASGEGIQHYLDALSDYKAKNRIQWGVHIAPHDIRVREWSTGQSRHEMAANLGINFDIAPNLPIIDGIESVRRLLSSAWFDEENCKAGIRSLRNYRKEWDDRRQAYKTRPLHDWTSHCADAMRYCAVSADQWESQPLVTLQSSRIKLATYVAGDSSIGY